MYLLADLSPLALAGNPEAWPSTLKELRRMARL